MVKKINTCIFISGNGSNLKFIIKNSREYNFPINVKLIISNNKFAYGLKYAKKYDIPYKYYPSNNLPRFERNCLIEIKKKNIKLLCLAGFMKVLSKNFLNNFKYKVINIHPSLLPKFKGLNTHKRVLMKKETYSGCTVHYVNSKLDSGNIIMKKKVFVKPTDTIVTLKNRVLKEEHKLYSKAIISLFR
tara:strand:- start:530 stop:1093 length:564 start_codon:yes stop_codon:yes gene_type:complete